MSTSLGAILSAGAADWARKAGHELARGDKPTAGRDRCDATLAGMYVGYALRNAHALVDGGADPADVRQLLEIGLQAGRAAA